MSSASTPPAIERCAQRARSRQQRVSPEPSRLAHDLMASTPRRSASFSSAISALFSRGFRTTKTGESIAAMQHTLPRAWARDFFLLSSFRFPTAFLLGSVPSQHTLPATRRTRRDGRHEAAERPAPHSQDVGCRWWDAKLVTYDSRSFASEPSLMPNSIMSSASPSDISVPYNSRSFAPAFFSPQCSISTSDSAWIRELLCHLSEIFSRLPYPHPARNRSSSP